MLNNQLNYLSIDPVLHSNDEPIKIGVYMIVQDCEQYLRRCLEKANGLWDYLAIVDTGTTEDNTIEVAKEHADYFDHYKPKWDEPYLDDFSAARNKVMSILPDDTTWFVWLDSDDVVLEPLELRGEIQDIPIGKIEIFLTPYRISKSIIFDKIRGSYKRKMKWFKRAHEYLAHEEMSPFSKKKYTIDSTIQHWKEYSDLRISRNRNLKILRDGYYSDSNDPHYILLLAYEYQHHKLYGMAADLIRCTNPEIFGEVATWYKQFFAHFNILMQYQKPLNYSPLPKNELDWNIWREEYENMDFKQQEYFYQKVKKDFPTQQHYTYPFIKSFLAIAQPKKVLEMGGWTGDLAKTAIADFGIESWLNYDVAQFSIKTEEYQEVKMDDFLWDYDSLPEFDTFVSTHTIEHLSTEHLIKLVKQLKGKAKYCIIEAPLPYSATDNSWHNYRGTHILPLGQMQVAEIFKEHGNFELLDIKGMCTIYHVRS